MAIFKCKMCGGALEINNNETVATCEYCGTQQTLPKLDDDRKANLYDRANHFRRNNEFDKAMGIYEQILNEDNTDAESYWSLVLCRYGIEYVEDPSSHKRIPTVNRAQFTSVFDDEDYKSALKYADGFQKEVYEAEAKVINEIQKGILAISQQEEPFDVFICYKETDSNGRRTQDSVIATELYHELTREGYKVFFSRITLEDKLGTAYEPYIFAALNSSKVMVVLGTKPEYFNAVWVKNEWSRYLSLIKNGEKKILIPAYRDMDPYDLPEEFSHLQAQDMTKLGFMQDLIRGINKLVRTETPPPTVVKETVVKESATGNVTSLLKRGFMALEDSEWNKADDFFEQTLNFDAELAQAYLGKLMAELKVCKKENLKDCAEPFDKSNNYQKAVRFGDASLKKELSGYIEYIITRNENACLEGVYKDAVNKMNSAKTESDYKKAADIFKSISTYKDSAKRAADCIEKAEIARKDDILNEAKKLMEIQYIGSIEDALTHLKSIPEWKNADELIIACQEKIIKLNEDNEKAKILAVKRAKKTKKIAIITTPIICAIIAFVIVLNTVIIPNNKYNDAIALMDAGNIIEAYEALVALDGYKDSADKASSIYDKYKVEKLKIAKVGDCVFFGAYEQDNNTSNGKEEIEWLVLEQKDKKVLVISKYALDCKPYNTSDIDITWDTCTLRKWLNSNFINSAFTADEKAMIPTVTVSADKNPEYSTNPGNATQDQVFLLSITEANKYFSSDSARQCKPTEYAVAGGAYVNSSNGNCWWWLRSPGLNSIFAPNVKYSGDILELGSFVNDDYYAVRPAMWISISD